jgi:hypothetical protein
MIGQPLILDVADSSHRTNPSAHIIAVCFVIMIIYFLLWWIIYGRGFLCTATTRAALDPNLISSRYWGLWGKLA